LPLIKFVAVLAALLGALGRSTSLAEELTVHFKTTPELKWLRPFADPADLSLLVTAADGRPVKAGSLAIRLYAPPRGFLFSTDYPLVEGTLLSELRLPLRDGKASWKYLFPIRGEYRLAVDVTTNDGSRGSGSFSIHVRENPKKWAALATLSVALLALGFVAGRIFSGTPANPGAVAAVLLAAMVGSVSAQDRRAGANRHLKIEPAVVGKATDVHWSFPGRDAGETPVALSLTMTHLEKEKVVFAIEKIRVPGEWSMKFHFPDGAAYRVTAIGEVPGQPPPVIFVIVADSSESWKETDKGAGTKHRARSLKVF
jgi:hypothetical protein